MKKNILRKILCSCIAVTMVFTGSIAFPLQENIAYAGSSLLIDSETDSEFAGGDGSKDNPYQIETIEQLTAIKHHLKDGYYYRLNNDLDFCDIGAGGETYQDLYGEWVAIGTDPDYFSFQGEFDGNGHTISNLNMVSGATAGLFGYCNGTIKNLKVENFNIQTTGSSAGAIVGELRSGGRMDQCAAVNCTVASAHDVGGIAGKALNGSKITNVYVEKGLLGLEYIYRGNKAEDDILGGATGGSVASVSDGLKKAQDIFATMMELLGQNAKGITMTLIKKFLGGDYNSAVRTSTIGGCVGFLGGEIDGAWSDFECSYQGGLFTDAATFFSGVLPGFKFGYYGAIAGRKYAGGSLKNCFSTKSTDEKECKKLSANFFGFWPLINRTASGTEFTIWNPNYVIEKKTRKNKEAYWAPILTIFSPDSENPNYSAYPDNKKKLLKALPEKAADRPKDEDGDGVYEIYTPYELAYIEFVGWDSYRLMNDIWLKDCGDPTHWNCNKTVVASKRKREEGSTESYQAMCVNWGNWVPLCRERDQYFDGDFYGDGHTIYGLKVATNEVGGLFGYVLGDIYDLNVQVDHIDAYGPAGGLAAGVFYPGNIYRCSVIGENGQDDKDEIDINGGGNADGSGVGGLVGIVGKDVVIKDCFARVNVSNENWIRRYDTDVMGIVLKSLLDVADPGIDGLKAAFAALPYSKKKEQARIDRLLGDDGDAASAFLQKQLSTLEGEEAKFIAERNKLNEEIGILKASVDDCDNDIKANESYIKDNKSRGVDVADEEKELGEARERKDRLTKQINSKTTERDKKNSEIAKAQIQKAKINKNKGLLDEKREKESAKRNEPNRQKAATWQAMLKNAKIVLDLLKTGGDLLFDWGIASYECRLGGLVGDCRGQLINCYSTGKVEKGNLQGLASYAGGLVGRTRTGFTSISSDGEILKQEEMIQNCYYIGTAGETGAGNRLTKEEMQREQSFKFDWKKTWKIDSTGEKNGGYPYTVLPASVSDAVLYGFSGGDGSENNPFIVHNYEQLKMVSTLWNSEYWYCLDANIIVEPAYFADTKFLSTNDESEVFRGHFDGGGYKIEVKCDQPLSTLGIDKGLFPRVAGTIKNLQLAGLKYSSDIGWRKKNNAGGICGTLLAGGTIENVQVSDCIIRGSASVGGVCGVVDGNAAIRNVKVSGVELITDPYADTVNASGQSDVSFGYRGGLIAGCNNGEIESAAADSNCINKKYNGSYYSQDAKKQGIMIWKNNGVFRNDLRGLSEATMINFTGVDFKNTWMIDNGKLVLRFRKPIENDINKNRGKAEKLIGEGTKENPYQISNGAALLRVAKKCSDKSMNGYSNLFFKQTNDIVLTSNEGYMIGNDKIPFRGSYDGGGFKIKINSEPVFGVTQGATIKNLTVEMNEEKNLKDFTDSEGQRSVPAYGGLAYATIDSLIFNCKMEGKLKTQEAPQAMTNLLELLYRIQTIPAGTMIATASNTIILNCLSNAEIIFFGNSELPVQKKLIGMADADDNFKSSFVGLNDWAAPIIENCMVKGDKNGSYCGSADKLVGVQAGNMVISTKIDEIDLSDEQSEKKIDGLNDVVDMPTELRNELWGWRSSNVSQDGGQVLALVPSMHTVKVITSPKCELKSAATIEREEERDTWKELDIPSGIGGIDGGREYVFQVRDNDKLILAVKNNMEKGAAIRWSVHEKDDADGGFVKRYDQKKDEEKEFDADTAEFVVDTDLDVCVFNEDENQISGFYVEDCDPSRIALYPDKEYSSAELREIIKQSGAKVATKRKYSEDKETSFENVNCRANLKEKSIILTYTSSGFTDIIRDINVLEVSGISVKTQPKLSYFKGEALNLAGGELEVSYNNGTSRTVAMNDAGVTVSGYDSNKFGKQTVTVTYAGKSATFDITVEKTVAVLEIIPPSKTTYKKGEALNLAGGKVRTVYDSGEKGQYVDLTSSMVSGYDPNKFGKQTVTVTYAGKSATFDVTVEKTIIGLEIIPPSKTTYKKGEALNLAGGKVRTVYDNGEKGQYVDITSEMVSGYDPDAKIGQTITVTYQGMTATFDVQKERVIESVGMKTLPSKTTYEDETIVEDFDITGGTIEIRYSDGSREEKNLLSPDITITIGNSYTAADGTMKRTINVSYKGFSTSFDVEVITNNPYRAITNGEASLVQYNQARQTNPDKLMVKYTGDNNKYTRYAYVKFNLNDLKAELEQRGLEIKSAELCYRAQSSAAGYARDLYLKEAAEKTWTKWSNRPAMSATLASTRINSTTPKFIVQDVTNYVKAKLAGGSVTFGFAASKCEGDSIYIPLGNEKPHLIIEVYEAPTISSIEVEAYPTLEYLKGQQLNLTGGSIKIIYSGGHIERKAFTDAEVSVSGYNPNLVGTQTITISYGGKNTQLNVNVYSVNNITVKNLPAAIQYKGEELNLAGGEITAKCSDGKSRVINMTEDGIIVKGYSKNKKGSQTLTLSYASKTVTFQINVVEKVKNVEGIRIVKKPKTSYKKGEAITFAGGQFQIIYSDGSKSEEITMNPKTPNGVSKGTTKAMNRKGSQIVIVKYTDPNTGKVFSTRYTIKVS